jgi:hypothetical protein
VVDPLELLVDVVGGCDKAIKSRSLGVVFGKLQFSADRRPGRRVIDQCNSSIDQCRIWLGLRMPPALGTTLEISRRCGAIVQDEAIVSPQPQAAINSGRAQNQRNVHGYDEHRYRASGIGR